MMVKLECPHCGRPGISRMRKILLGPVTSTTCKACGEKLSVSYLSVLFLVPFFAAMVWWALAVEPFWGLAAVCGGALAFGVISFLSMPLQKR
jgi:predicted RNA-binding Zn-ribbon protein involved in translation (DUF1610 family)